MSRPSHQYPQNPPRPPTSHRPIIFALTGRAIPGFNSRFPATLPKLFRMALAVCIRCGGRKEHALAACPQCGFAPKRKEDEAKSFYLSDHNLSPDALADAAERIDRGEEIPYNRGRLKGVVAASAAPKIIYGLPVDHWRKLGMAALAGLLLGSCLWGLLSMRELF